MPALAAVGIYTLAMFVIVGVVAVIVYRKLAVEIVRRAWIDLDLVWIGVLALTVALTLRFALWPLLPT